MHYTIPNLTGKTKEQIEQLFYTIPSDTTSLHFKAVTFNQIAVVTELLPKISPTVTSIDFTGNIICPFPSLLPMIPPTVTTLNLSSCWLVSEDAEDSEENSENLNEVLLAIPDTILHLNLSNNNLSALPPKEYLHNLKPNLRSLDLSNNSLGIVYLSIYFMRLLPDNLTDLNLADDKLDTSGTVIHVIDLLKKIKDTMRTVNLGDNDRPTQRPPEEQAQIRRALSDKNFVVTGNGSDIQLAAETLKSVIQVSDVEHLINSYLAEGKESLGIFAKPVPAVTTGQTSSSNLSIK